MVTPGEGTVEEGKVVVGGERVPMLEPGSSGLLPEGENIPGLGAFFAHRGRCGGGVWRGRGRGRRRGRGGLRGGGASIGAALRVRVFARALHGGNVAAVPHARAAQLAQVVKAARDSG